MALPFALNPMGINKNVSEGFLTLTAVEDGTV